jgi:hypothetical protein
LVVNGLTFLELKGVLEKNELLDFLIENRMKLSTGYYQVTPEDQINQLVARGLVLNNGMSRFFLTEVGRSFLNKIEALKIDTRNAK